jgi:hypothetical protein
MDFGEKVLYHQIHPAKLASDIGGSLLSTYLMWRRRFAWAMLAAFVPAALASVLVIRYADLEKRKRWMRRLPPCTAGTKSFVSIKQPQARKGTRLRRRYEAWPTTNSNRS